MFLKLRPLAFSIIFFACLEIMVFKHGWAAAVAGFLFILALSGGKSIGNKWKFSILPVFYTLASSALLYLITLGYEQQIFIILSTFLYYLSLYGAFRLSEYENDQTAKGMNMAASAATIFFTYAGVYGLYLNFLVPLYILMIAYLIITLLVSYQHLSIIRPQDMKIVWTYSVILSLVMTELIWTMNFWPFGYLTTGVIALILYYVLWDVIQSHFMEELTRRKVVSNTVLFFILIALVLLSSKWIPVL